MRDRPAEVGLARLDRIDMEKVPVLRAIGKAVDDRLVDEQQSET